MDSGLAPATQPGPRRRAKQPRAGGSAARSRRLAEPAGRPAGTAPVEGEPAAVVVAGSPARARGAVVRELVSAGPPGVATPWPDVPADSYLVLRHGPARTARAYLPGARQPQAYPLGAPAEPGATAHEPPPGRPPRRVELALPAPALADFTLVAAPAAGGFGPAYTQIVLDTAERTGALLIILDTQVLPSQAELEFLVEAAQRAVAPFFAVWLPDEPPAARPDAGPAADAPRAVPADIVAGFRDVVASRVPRFADAPWFPVQPGSGAADLRQALAGWAQARRQRDSGRCAGPARPPASVAAPARPPAGTTPAGPAQVGAAPAGRRPVPTAVDGRESGWEELLDRVTTVAQHGIRQQLSIELANIHLRGVQDIVFGGGTAAMPATLDRELHALSLRGGSAVEAAITEVTRQVLAHVLAEAPYDEVLHRVAVALAERIDQDWPQLDRVLLITSIGGGVATVAGGEASASLAAYQPRVSPDPARARGCGCAGRPALLPPLAIGLSAGCYQKWRDDAKADQDAARDWLGQALRDTDLELQRVLAERFDAVRQVLGALIAEAVDHGLLLV